MATQPLMLKSFAAVKEVWLAMFVEEIESQLRLEAYGIRSCKEIAKQINRSFLSGRIGCCSFYSGGSLSNVVDKRLSACGDQ